MTEEESLYENVGSSFADAVPGKLFGKPCFKVYGKAFMCFFQTCAVFKLPPEERDAALAKESAVLFDPSGKGRPMKEWVQLSSKHKADWKPLAKAALDYVKSGAE